jgi:glucose-1-phosphate adenylyltransferase
MIKMIALILGGGAGTRLYPLTGSRSKPAVPIAGKYRLIDIPISNCINSGVKRIFVLTQYNSASLNQHIKNTYQFDAFHHGFVDILAAEQTPTNSGWFQGTADAVRQCQHHLNSHDYDYILILSGDQLYQMDFYDMVSYHIKQNADLTIATIAVDAKDATSFGIMKVDKKGIINNFIEKPAKAELPKWKSEVNAANQKAKKHFLASMGIYIFKKSVMNGLLEEYKDATDFGKEIIPTAIKKGKKVASYDFNGYWTDIGNIPSFFEANIKLADNLPEFNFYDSHMHVYTRPRMLAPSKIFGTKFNKAVVSEGSIIHAKSISNSVVGIRSRIGENTSIDNCIVMGADYYETLEEIVTGKNIPMGIGKNSKLAYTIVDKNARIGENVTIVGSKKLKNIETDTYVVVDGIVVIKKNAVIESGTVVK